MRQIIRWGCACIVLAVSCSLCYAWGRASAMDERRQQSAVSSPAAVDSLEVFRTERQQLRQMQLSQLSEIIHSSNPDAKMIALAQQRQLELMNWSEQELTLESILAMRGFQDVVVTVHTDSVNVMVRSEAVSKQEAAVILELVTRETGISGGNVKIIPLN